MTRHNCGGCLVLFWGKKKIDLIIDSSSLNYTDAIINNWKENSWMLTRFYGAPDQTHKHHESWDPLSRLNHHHSLPWLYSGDFNEITKSHENRGGRLRQNKKMQDFQDVLDECDFMDLGFMGNNFIWRKVQATRVTIWERLD